MNRLSPRASGQNCSLYSHILALTALTRWAAVRVALRAVHERGETASAFIICGQTWSREGT